jgi:hypothetical protein
MMDKYVLLVWHQVGADDEELQFFALPYGKLTLTELNTLALADGVYINSNTTDDNEKAICQINLAVSPKDSLDGEYADDGLYGDLYREGCWPSRWYSYKIPYNEIRDCMVQSVIIAGFVL